MCRWRSSSCPRTPRSCVRHCAALVGQEVGQACMCLLPCCSAIASICCYHIRSLAACCLAWRALRMLQLTAKDPSSINDLQADGASLAQLGVQHGDMVGGVCGWAVWQHRQQCGCPWSCAVQCNRLCLRHFCLAPLAQQGRLRPTITSAPFCGLQLLSLLRPVCPVLLLEGCRALLPSSPVPCQVFLLYGFERHFTHLCTTVCNVYSLPGVPAVRL